MQGETDALRKESSAAMEAMRKTYFEKYQGDEIYSEAANEEWQREYKAYRESDAQKAREAKGEELSKSLQPFLVKPERPGSFDEFETTHGYVWLHLRK